MNLQFYEKIKKLAIIALFSDDDLMERLVLKGGNALDIVLGIAQRSSLDLDFSIENDFRKDELYVIKSKIEKTLTGTFIDEGYQVFDITFAEKPENVKNDELPFWGGYSIEFKIIETERYGALGRDLEALRRNATVIDNQQRRKIKIDISKYEYCAPKQEHTLDDFTIYVYTPEMIAIEKLRAICQQMPAYTALVHSNTPTARARDFFDIYTILDHYKINLATPANIELIKNIFSVKHVPLNLIENLHRYRDYHRYDFIALKNTVKIGTDLKDFDFYFDYVIERCSELKAFWKI